MNRNRKKIDPNWNRAGFHGASHRKAAALRECNTRYGISVLEAQDAAALLVSLKGLY